MYTFFFSREYRKQEYHQAFRPAPDFQVVLPVLWVADHPSLFRVRQVDRFPKHFQNFKKDC